MRSEETHAGMGSARLEDTWVQDTGNILEGSVNNQPIQVKRQSRDWSVKVARANKKSRFMDISFSSTTATEEQLTPQARRRSIKEPIFRIEGGAIFGMDPITLPMVACVYVNDHKTDDSLPEEQKVEDRRIALRNREG